LTWKLGGVARYNSLLKKHLSVDADFLFVGRRRTGAKGIGIKRLISDKRNFRQALITGKYDLVHLNPSLAWKAVIRDGYLLQTAKANRIPVVVFIHGWNRRFESKLRGWRLRLFRNVFFQADAIVVLANEFKKKIECWGYSGPVYTETTAFDDKQTSEFIPDAFDEEWSHDINLLFLASLEKRKGIYETIETYRILKDRYTNLTLTVAGDGPELGSAQQYVARIGLKGVRFLGDVRDNIKDGVFRRASIYLLPTSHGEGMPTSVLEAMAFGLPVITRAVGGLRDFFENGRMGFMTGGRDPAIFAQMLEKLITEPELRRRISRYNHEYAMERFLASKVARRIETIYQHVMRSAGKRGPVTGVPAPRFCRGTHRV